MMISVAKTIDPRISPLASKTTSSAGRPLRLGQPAVLAQAPDDVLDVDDGVVHQRADGDGHAAQGHGVDGGPERLHGEHRGHQRERDREQRDDAGPHVGEEQEDDDDDQHRAFGSARQHVVDGRLDEVGLAEDAAVSISMPLGSVAWMSSSTASSARGEFQRVGAGLLLDAEDHRRPRRRGRRRRAWARADATSATSRTITGPSPRIATTVSPMSSTPRVHGRPVDQVLLAALDVEAGRGVPVRRA